MGSLIAKNQRVHKLIKPLKINLTLPISNRFEIISNLIICKKRLKIEFLQPFFIGIDKINKC